LIFRLKDMELKSKKWIKTTLGEVAICRNGAGIKQEFFRDSGVPLVRVSDFSNDSIDMQNVFFIDPIEAKKWEQYRLRHGDVVIATVGSWPPNWSSVVGKAIRVPESAEGAIQNQNSCCVLSHRDIADQRFIFYLLRSNEFILYAANSAGGSANQARLPVGKLENFNFSLPPLATQHAIAHILGSLDDKIELNRQMNETLEAMARAIFKSWFVDFDPVRAKAEGRQPAGMDAATAALFPDGFEEIEGREVPKGWGIGMIGESTKIVGGSTPSTTNPKYWEEGTNNFATPKDLASLSTSILLETEKKITDEGVNQISSRILPIGTVLLSSRAPIGYTAITTIPVSINQGFIAIICEKKLPNYYVLIWVKENMLFIIDRANGTTFLEISKSNFKPMEVIIPSNDLLNKFVQMVKSLYLQIENNEKENRTLAQIRDGLLPKLIVGEIQVG